MKIKSQTQQVKDILLNQGEISRNVCIKELFITRLSAIIQNLETEGWEFNPEFVKTERGKDFVYYLKKSPYKKVAYFIPELNHTIEKYERI